MKRRGRIIVTVLAVVMIFSSFPVLAIESEDDIGSKNDGIAGAYSNNEIAADADLSASGFSVQEVSEQNIRNDHPDASYIITDNSDRQFELEYDHMTGSFTNFPKSGDKIKIYYSGNTSMEPDEVFVYQNGNKEFVNDSKTLKWELVKPEYGDSSVMLRVFRGIIPPIYRYGYYYNINKAVPSKIIRAPLKSIIYTPSNVTVYSENIKESAYGGGYIYNYLNRAKHTAGNKTWKSAFKEGDSVTAILEDNSRIKYTNKIVFTETGYADRFTNDDGEILLVKADYVRLSPGNNQVLIYLPKIPNNIQTTINVYMSTTPIAEDNGSTDEAADSGSSDNSSGSGSTGGDSASGTESDPIPDSGKVGVAKAKLIKAFRLGQKAIIRWKKLTDSQKKKVSKVEIQYSTNKKFSSSSTVSKRVKNSKTSYTSPKLSRKTTYYVRVRNLREYKGKYYASAWSAVKKVKTK